MIWWFLEAGVWQAMEQARKLGASLTTEAQAQFEARLGLSDREDSSRVLTIAGDTAQIAVQGVLTKAPDFFAMAFGGGNTAYPEIISALAQAESNPDVKQVVLAVSSPGGEVDGMFDTIDAITAFSKPIKAVVSGVAASAAFALVAAADSIEARSRADRFGSIGIQASFFVSDHEITLRSTNAPKKNPDPSTPEGEAAIVEELDGLHALFSEAIAKGRNVTSEKVDNTFGQGATLLAEEALKRGMIDNIAGQPLKLVPKPNTSTNAESTPMNLQELQVQHPETYALAVAVGTTAERDRVSAHLTMGAGFNAMTIALAAVKDGSGMTAALNAEYLTAGRAADDIAARQGDDDQAGGAADNADGSAAGESEDGAVLSGVEALLGTQPAA